MCVEVADGAVPLAKNRHPLQSCAGAPEACRHVGEFLAQRGRARRLAVSAGQHRQGRVFAGRAGQPVLYVGQCRQQYARARGRKQTGVAQIVDVLGGAAEVHQFEQRRRRASGREGVAHVVFHGFDIVIDAPLDRLDGRRSAAARIGHQTCGAGAHARRQWAAGKLGQGIGQLQQPQGLDADALADEAGFGKEITQRRRGRRITAVDRGYREERVVIHGRAVRVPGGRINDDSACA